MFLIPISFVVLSALYVDLTTALMTSVLSAVATDFFFVKPYFELGFSEPRDVLRSGVFLVISISLSILVSTTRTALEKAEAAKSQLSLLIDSIPSLVGYVDSERKARLSNQTLSDWAGIPVSKMVGMPVRDLIGDEAYLRVVDRMDLALRGGSVRYDSSEMRAGKLHHFDIQYIPDFDPLGRVRGYFFFAHDVTNQVEAIRIRDEFLSVASHELRTPITSMRLNLQIFKRNMERGNPGAFEPERIRKMVVQTDQQLGRLVRLVEDMLDISRINTGQLSVRAEIVDLALLIRESVARLDPQLSRAGCQVDQALEENVYVSCDPFRIEQVITNLITNAYRYGAGKPINICMDRTADGFAEIQIVDHGIGIAPENQERIFGRFERAVGPDEISGLGLGLFIVKKIVSLHQGSIRVESAMGRGSTFLVKLPVAVKARSQASA